jgi:hypothetical protein
MIKSGSNVNALVSFFPFQGNNINATFCLDKIMMLPSQLAISHLNLNVAKNYYRRSIYYSHKFRDIFSKSSKSSIYGVALEMAKPVSAKINKIWI